MVKFEYKKRGLLDLEPVLVDGILPIDTTSSDTIKESFKRMVSLLDEVIPASEWKPGDVIAFKDNILAIRRWMGRYLPNGDNNPYPWTWEVGNPEFDTENAAVLSDFINTPISVRMGHPCPFTHDYERLCARWKEKKNSSITIMTQKDIRHVEPNESAGTIMAGMILLSKGIWKHIPPDPHWDDDETYF